MGGGSQQQQTTKTEPWSGQQPYLTKGFSEAEDLYDNGPQQFYPGQTYTDMSPFRTAGLSGTVNQVAGGNGLSDAATGYATNTLQGNSDNPWAALLGTGAQGMAATANGAYLNNNPYLDQVYDSAAGKAADEWQNTIMPGIASSFGMSGGAGTTMANEMAVRSGGELSDSLAQLKSSIYGGNYQQERDRQTQAQGNLSNLGANLYGTGVNERLNLTGQSGQLRDNQFSDFDRLGQVGQQMEDQQGKEIQSAIDRWNFGQNAPYAALQDYMSMITGNYGSTSTTRGGSSGSGLATGLGAAASIIGMMSDVRLKSDIHHVGELNGAKLYTFRYTRRARKAYGLPDTVQLGVMAQEVEKTHPDCVHTNDNGHKMVDYGLLFARPAQKEAA